MFSDNVNVNCDWGNHGSKYCGNYTDLENIDYEITTQQKSGLCICHINIVSLNKNIGKIKFLSHSCVKLDVICLSETCLNINNINCVNLPGYNLYFNNSLTSAGGAAIFVSENLECTEIARKLRRCLGGYFIISS